jgi:2-phospho-L-lactate guanylyltransferase
MTEAWVVVVAQKSLAVAKSRLRLAAHQRERVARAMFQDTVLAARCASRVRRVVVVADRDCDARAVSAPDVLPVVLPTLDLNAALRVGARLGCAAFPDARVAAMPADLPGLQARELDAALEDAADHERAFVADRHRLGTTLLTARAGAALDPRFGPASRLAHRRSGAHETTARDLAGLRHDVDDLDDLAELVRTLTPGPHLRRVLDAGRYDNEKEIA